MRSNRTAPPPAETGLERLLRLERELELRLVDARAEADRILSEARARAASLTAKEELAAEAAESALVSRLAEERKRTIAALNAKADQTRELLRRLDQARLQGLADRILDRLAGDSGPGNAA